MRSTFGGSDCKTGSFPRSNSHSVAGTPKVIMDNQSIYNANNMEMAERLIGSMHRTTYQSVIGLEPCHQNRSRDSSINLRKWKNTLKRKERLSVNLLFILSKYLRNILSNTIFKLFISFFRIAILIGYLYITQFKNIYEFIQG